MTEILSLEFFVGCIIFVILLITGLINVNRRKSKNLRKKYKPDNQQDFDYYGKKRNPDHRRTDDTLLFPERQKTLYDEKLSDPKWKERRKQILKRDHYQCQWCGNKDNLQIHHKYYSKYPDGKNVSLGTIQTRHSSRYAVNAIKNYIARKKSRSITGDSDCILYKLECTIQFRFPATQFCVSQR